MNHRWPKRAKRVRLSRAGHRHAIGFSLWLTLIFVGCRSSSDANGEDARRGVDATITRVIDGDTVQVHLGEPFTDTETVRLLGIDTPEKPGGPRPPECGGSSSSAFTAAALPLGTPVWLARDSETRDIYGRLLAWVIRVDDGVIINLAIVEAGHATALTISPNVALRDEVEAAEGRAKRDHRGFWSECDGEPYPLDEP